MGLKPRRSHPAQQERKAPKSRVGRGRTSLGHKEPEMHGLPSASRNVSDREKVRKEAATFRTPHGEVISGMDVYDAAYIVEPSAPTVKEVTYVSTDPIKNSLNLARTYLNEVMLGTLHKRPQSELRKDLGYVRRLCKAVVGLCDLVLGDSDE